MHNLTVEDVPRPTGPSPDADRVPLADLRVAGTPLEDALRRVVEAASVGRSAVAAFSSSI
jgi:FXSXX-COOH protein